MRLRYPDFAGDLTFGHVAVEAQQYDPAFPIIESPRATGEQQLDVAALWRAWGARPDSLILFAGQRQSFPRQLRHECPLDVALLGLERSGDLSRRRRTAELRPELLPAAADLSASPLYVAGDPHRARAVTEMTPDLTVDHSACE